MSKPKWRNLKPGEEVRPGDRFWQDGDGYIKVRAGDWYLPCGQDDATRNPLAVQFERREDKP